MELRQLRHFVTVADEGSFTKAAVRLNLVQSAVSTSMKMLEANLGAQLLDRTTRRLSLTAAGRALLPEARATLAAADAALEAVQTADGGYVGTLRVGIMQTMRFIDLAGVVRQFTAERPGVDIVPRVAPQGSKDLIREVASGDLDIAFVAATTSSHRAVNLRPIVSVPLRLLVPQGHRLESRARVNLTELDGESFIETPAGWGLRTLTDQALAGAGVRRDISVEVADMSTVVELVRAGLGLGFMPVPSPVLMSDVSLVRLRPEPIFTISLALPTQRAISAAARAFVSLVERSLR